MFFRAAAKRQLWNQQKKKKNQEKQPIIIPRYVYMYGTTGTPRPKCTNCSLNLFGYVVVAVLLSYFLFKKAFFFCLAFRWWLLYETKFSTSTLCAHWIQRPVIKVVRLCFFLFAFISVIISLLSSGPVAFISVYVYATIVRSLTVKFSCSSWFFLTPCVYLLYKCRIGCWINKINKSNNLKFMDLVLCK